MVWFFDTAKGALTMFIIAKLTGNFPKPAGAGILFLALVGVAAVAGHCWSIFLSFIEKEQMPDYNRRYNELSEPIWNKEYLKKT